MTMRSSEEQIGRRAPRAGRLITVTVIAAVVMLGGLAPAASAPPPAAAATSLTDAEREVVRLVNKERTQRGLPALRIRTPLCRAADRHSRDMLVRGFFSHRSSNGQTLGPRTRRYGYSAAGCLSWRVGENIAWGTGAWRSPALVVRLWMNSRSHRAAILDPRHWDIGVGRRKGSFRGRRDAIITTADFGRRIRLRDDVPGAPQIDDLAVEDPTSLRTRDGSRESCSVRYSTNEPALTRITVRRQDGSRARTVSSWMWMPAGTRTVTWDGTIEARVTQGRNTVRRRVPAPDGRYTILVEARDIGGTKIARTEWVTCASDGEQWGDGATFVTAATRHFAFRRGRRAVFRFLSIYVPPSGGAVPASTVRLTLKLHDSNGRSRYTRSWSNVPLNRTRWHSIRRCWLRRGTYRYVIYATLPDGTQQQIAVFGRVRIR